MSSIFNVNFGAAVSHALQNQSVKFMPDKNSEHQQDKQKEILDAAYLSKTSKNLNEERKENSGQFSENYAGNVTSVKFFILSHKTEAMEQQANQSKISSLALMN